MAKKTAPQNVRAAVSHPKPTVAGEPTQRQPMPTPRNKAEATEQIARLIRANKRSLDALAKL